MNISKIFFVFYRTKEPCGGMPKGDIITTIPNGGKLKVEWHLSKPDRGGFKIELITEQGWQDFPFTQGFVGTDDDKVSSRTSSTPP